MALAKLPISTQLIQVIKSAEFSGQLELSLDKYLQQQAILGQQKIASLYEWLPRFYYILVAAFAISVIF